MPGKLPEGKENTVRKNRRGENPRFQLLAGGYSEWRVRHAETGGEFCMMETVVPANGGVPIHRHAEDEVFYVLDGELEIGKGEETGIEWMTAGIGECIYVPGDAWHGFRNAGSTPVRMLTLAMGDLGAFFEEAGRPLQAGETPHGPPTPEAIQRLREISRKYRQAFLDVTQ